MIPAAALAVVLVLMLAELWLSLRHERSLLMQGAVAPPDPAYGSMRWAYPTVFVVMAAEGVLLSRDVRSFLVPGIVLFAASKLLKAWAIASLGDRWTYKILVIPGAPLVSTGPYRFLRHPNYIAVIGELIGFAFATGARLTGPLALVFFSWLLARRIRAEEQALGIY